MKRESSARGGIGDIFIAALKALFEKECPTTAAAIAYFSLFTLFPAVILLFELSNHFLAYLEMRDAAIERITAIMPGARRLIAEKIAEIDSSHPSIGVILSCLLIFLWSASWVFTFIEDALNRAWEVAEGRTFWRRRILAIVMVFVCCSMLLFSLFVPGVIAAMRTAARRLPLPAVPEPAISLLWHMALGGISLLLTFAVFATIFKLLPNTRVRFLEVLPGALISAVLWQSANYLFAWLLPHFNYQRVFGSLGAAIAILTWSYLSSLIMLYGAQISANLHRFLVGPPWPCAEMAKEAVTSLARPR